MTRPPLESSASASGELCRQLRDLEGRAKAALVRDGRGYSRRQASEALGRPPYSRPVAGQRISSWVPLRQDREPQVPSDRNSDDVLALIRLWSSWAGEKPDERSWRNLLEKARSARAAHPGPAGPGQPVTEATDPFALQVQESIDAAGAGAGVPLPVLPPYAPRQHDRWLAGVVGSVAQRATGEAAGAIAVLVGGSSTGKTRACWEALRLLPADWRLVHPLVPGPAEALITALDRVRPRTVLWLDEIHDYLSGERGAEAAARLREAFADPARGPLLVLGTTWPGAWTALVRARRKGERGDPRASVRALLTCRHHRVPDTFEEEGLPELRRLAAVDPRIREALECAEEGQITQYLAGGRALVDRYDTATALQRALIEPAMDALRLGHDTGLPRLLLEAALPHYLTGQQYEWVADGDIDSALAELGEPWRGTRGPLTDLTVRAPGRPLVRTGSVRLAPYLDQHGRRTRRTGAPPAGFWDTLVDHASPRSLIALAASARDRGHLRIAFRLLTAAAEAGVPGAVPTVSQLLSEEGRYEEALLWCGPPAEAGDAEAMSRVAGIMEMARRPAEAVAWHRRAAEAGHSASWSSAGHLLRSGGHLREAEECLRRAVDAGVRGSHGELASLLAGTGRTEEALVHHRRDAETEGGHAVAQTAALMRERGDSGVDILAWLLSRVADENRTKDPVFRWAWGALVTHLAEDTGSRDLIRRAATSAGAGPEATRELTALADLAERVAAGEHLRGAPDTAEAAEALRREGSLEEALAIYEAEAQAEAQSTGNRDAAVQAAALHEQLGRPASALDRYRRAAEQGHPDALGQTARLMTGAVGEDETFVWLRTCADGLAAEGRPDQRSTAAELLHAAGRTDEALAWLHDASRAGDPYAWIQYAELLESADRSEDARRLRRYGWEPGGAISAPWSAAPPEHLAHRSPGTGEGRQ
ncbi:hypothetical protein [Streptomyces yaizuensis]|uniref:Tetratricopeptide repeat protein n=1 Tax=Streptomyces yaizuensis TaxID=2989713 RepID=A0ABQ5P046_9ACTN|nr:hypothetical protein [Streptomyces sp. YSPA8]GLF95887.1 tetratricopeptide repeat protein [Streptomyces sp. YSPA8]